MDDPPQGRLDREGHGIGNGVADRDEADAERPDPNDVARLDLVHVRLEGGLILLELVPDQPQRQTRPVERDVEARQHEGQGPRMVLVSMGDDDPQTFSRFASR